ncbi:MAG: hypothetical protein IT329_15635 [Caldilineaceae bacterium]|nr:hypothetical protein [Caldilineaceae bacterium]
MKTFSSAQWRAAVEWLQRDGRTLDRALFAYSFRHGSAAAVLRELATYQNVDGGFGHGLEPDIRTPASSPLATSVAFGRLRRLSAAADHPLVRRGIGYYLATYDAAGQRWPMAFADVEAAPHAPWWTFDDLERNFAEFGLNPTASVLGHLYDYPGLVPDDLAAAVFGAVLQRAQSRADAMEMHDLLCLIELADARTLEPGQRAAVVAQVERALPTLLIQDPARWDGYGIKPLDIAPAPGARFAGCVARELVEQQLDHWIEAQQTDGAWPIPWSWAEVDAAAWAQAQRDWQGHQITMRLATLAAYGRVEWSEVYQSATLPSVG